MPSPQKKVSCESDFQELFSRSPYVVKNLPANEGDLGSIPASGRSPGEGNGNPSSVLAWETPRTEEPGKLHSMRSHGVRHN